MERSSLHHHSRTRHAREERARGDRPIAAALKDVRRAELDAFLVDAESDAIVVVGPHLRTHVFNREGKLITSINCEGDEVRKKIKVKRWRPALADEVELFLEAVNSFKGRDGRGKN